MSDKIELSGIFSEGYGVIPKKLMRMKLDDKIGKQRGRNVKLVLCYLLSYSGGGASAFPSIRTIAKDLEMSTTTVMQALVNAEQLSLISKHNTKMINGEYKNNIYHLDFLINTERGVSENDTGVYHPIAQGVSENDTGVYQRLIPNNNNKIITYNNIYSPLLEIWNNKKELTTHLESSIKRNFKKRHYDIINDHGVDSIKKAIENYHEVITNTEQFYSHKFTLWRFLEKVDEFLDSAQPWNNWKIDSTKKIKTADEISTENYFKKLKEQKKC